MRLWETPKLKERISSYSEVLVEQQNWDYPISKNVFSKKLSIPLSNILQTTEGNSKRKILNYISSTLETIRMSLNDFSHLNGFFQTKWRNTIWSQLQWQWFLWREQILYHMRRWISPTTTKATSIRLLKIFRVMVWSRDLIGYIFFRN